MDIGPCNWGHTVVYRLPARLDPGSWIVRILSLTPDAVFLYIYPHHHWGPHNCIFRTPKKERRSSLQLLYNKLREALWHIDPPTPAPVSHHGLRNEGLWPAEVTMSAWDEGRWDILSGVSLWSRGEGVSPKGKLKKRRKGTLTYQNTQKSPLNIHHTKLQQ